MCTREAPFKQYKDKYSSIYFATVKVHCTLQHSNRPVQEHIEWKIEYCRQVQVHVLYLGTYTRTLV